MKILQEKEKKKEKRVWGSKLCLAALSGSFTRAFQTLGLQFRNGLCPMRHTGSVISHPAVKQFTIQPVDSPSW